MKRISRLFRTLLIIAAFSLMTQWACTPPACIAQDGVFLAGGPVPAGTTVVSGSTPLVTPQQLIPKLSDGSNFPAGQLIGWGPVSRLIGTSTTKDQQIAALVATEGWNDSNQSEWQRGTYQERSGNIIGATNTNPIEITTSTPHTRLTGARVSIAGARGNSNANGTWYIERTEANKFKLYIDAARTQPVRGNDSFTSGGTWSIVSGAATAGPMDLLSNTDYQIACLSPVVRDLTIQGFDDSTANGPYGTGGSVVDNPNHPLYGNPGTGTISGASNSARPNPIVVTSTGHHLLTGMKVTIAGVKGNTAANGTWTITRVNDNAFGLDGSAGNGTYTNGGEWTLHDLYDGLVVLGQGAVVEHVNLFYIPGTALHTGRPGSSKAWASQPFDTKTAHSIHGVSVKRAYRGVNIDAVDSIIGDIDVSQVRDYAIRLVGAIQVDGAIHTYGGKIGAWIQGHHNWGGPWYCEQSPINMQIDGNGNTFHDLYFNNVTASRHLVVNGGSNRLTRLSMGVPAGKIGIELNGQFNHVSDCDVGLGDGATGVRITNGTGQQIRGEFVGATAGSTIVAVRAEVELNRCRLDIHVYGPADCRTTGVDLNFGNTGRLGTGNQIHVTTTGSVNTPINWPGGETWQKATPVNTPNIITINGERFYPPVR